jgi:adenosyl cobinamide kinase/adenosyl cobinamide phosphate guanylyltransferase
VITLVLGGARSGKSVIAEGIAGRLPAPVTYVATGLVTDTDMADRIAAHRARRPSTWATLEVGGDGDLAGCLLSTMGTVLVDSLGTWVATRNVVDEALAVDGEKLADAIATRDGDTVVVSEEVGMSVHPLTESGRRFVDAVGVLNQAVAAVADDVVLVVAGRTLTLDGGG